MPAIHAPGRHGAHSAGQSTAQRSHSTKGLRCDTIILQHCGSDIQHSKAQQSTAKHSKALHGAEQGHRKEAKLQGPPLAASWETRKCDQGPCMRPITRGFPAISLSMIPSSGDRRSSVPRPTSSKGPGGAWGPRAATKSQPLHAMGVTDRRTADSRSPASRACYATLLLRCRGQARHSPIFFSRSPQQSDPRKPVATCGLCTSNENDRKQATMCGLLTLGRRVATIFSSF